LKKIFSLLLILSFIFFQSCSTSSFKQNIEANHSVEVLFEKVDSVVINKMNQYNIPGLSIGLVRNDSILYTKGYGVRCIEKNDLVTENTIFHTASISKLFTAVATMKLIEQNGITIDDKLVEILPELKYDDERVNEITIKNLLNHTSGLPDISNYHWDNNHQSDNSLREFVLGFNLKLNSEPSSEYQYSNLAYDILGYVIEKVSGSTFDDFLKENVLNKSGMYSSDFRYFKIHDSLKTSPHSKRWVTKKIYKRETYPYTREHAPSSTLNSSSKDLSKWMISFLQTLNDSVSINQSMINSSSNSTPYIGLGFQLDAINSEKVIGHYGGDKGFRSYLIMIPEEKIGLVVLANCDYNEDFRQEIIHPIVKLMLTMYIKNSGETAKTKL
jgi:CubicO group peptidase (beta-lactamase class C family)